VSKTSFPCCNAKRNFDCQWLSSNASR
jgi:hypothetical protein